MMPINVAAPPAAGTGPHRSGDGSEARDQAGPQARRRHRALVIA